LFDPVWTARLRLFNAAQIVACFQRRRILPGRIDPAELKSFSCWSQSNFIKSICLFVSKVDTDMKVKTANRSVHFFVRETIARFILQQQCLSKTQGSTRILLAISDAPRTPLTGVAAFI
jgi:hypothetical protein